MKGEFEQRLRSVIDEVQSSPIPIILFIDEAHTLIGAGGQAGTGDAANLLKPALARGTLRTIAATTWAEYRQYIEKDPALTRRFQPIMVGEPDVATAAIMLRGLIAPMEKHHKVRVTDEAIVAAVNLSNRYIPARQLPDKAVSLLDTACARVAISQNAKPAAVEDAEVEIASLEGEKASLLRERDLGAAKEDRVAEIDAKLASAHEKLDRAESGLGTRARAGRGGACAARDNREGVCAKTGLRGGCAIGACRRAAAAHRRACASPGLSAKSETELQSDGQTLRVKVDELGKIDPEKRMIYAHVDEQAVASVVSDWTGIPVGKMVADEVETVLNLAGILNRRIVGQSHGLEMIAKRIETNRARLDNPMKPIGVFMLCGPSRRRQDGDGARARRNAVRRRTEHHHDQHVRIPGGPYGLDAQGRAARLCRLWRRGPPDGGGAPPPLQRRSARRDRESASRCTRGLLPGVRQGCDGGRHGRRIDFKNTLILLTTNVGTEIIMDAAKRTPPPDPETLAAALRPALLEVFPPALLGRIVTIPYYPLSGDMLAGIVRLQLGRVGKRIEENHRAKFVIDPSAIDHIVSLCHDPRFRRPCHRQHHHQHDPAIAVARDPQAFSEPRGDTRSQSVGGGWRVRL